MQQHQLVLREHVLIFLNPLLITQIVKLGIIYVQQIQIHQDVKERIVKTFLELILYLELVFVLLGIQIVKLIHL